MIFREGFAALGTTEPLKAVTMFSEAIAGDTAGMAGHLAFLRLRFAGKSLKIILRLGISGLTPGFRVSPDLR